MKVGAGRIRRGELQLHQGTIGAVNWGLPSKLGAGTEIGGSLTEVGDDYNMQDLQTNFRGNCEITQGTIAEH